MSEKVTELKVHGSLSKEQAQQVKALLSSTRELTGLEEGLRRIFGSELGTTARFTRTDCGSCNCSTGVVTCIVYEYIIGQGGGPRWRS